MIQLHIVEDSGLWFSYEAALGAVTFWRLLVLML